MLKKYFSCVEIKSVFLKSVKYFPRLKKSSYKNNIRDPGWLSLLSIHLQLRA